IKLVIAVSIILTISSCSLPIKAVKVKSSDSVNGVRYVLKRPSFKVGLRLINIKNTNFLKIDKKVYDDYNDSKTPIIKHSINTTNPDWLTEYNDQEYNYYCLHPESKIQVTFQQKMTGTPFIYEVTSRATPPHWFADSESSIVMDDKGNLIGISAGETDRSLEFIESIAALASKSAKAGAFSKKKVPDTNYCLLFIDESFHRYITEHLKLDKAKKILQINLKKLLVH
nr:hypothetical protein [Bacteroidota bacterium]